jgi:hypothetical protein
MWYDSKTELTNNFDAQGSERKARDECTNNGSIKDNGIWRTKHNNELYTFYCEPDIV